MPPNERVKLNLADSPPSIIRLEIAPHFSVLSDKEKRYAHYLSLASFAGIRIILRQVSPEAEPIFDLILALYRKCAGDWPVLQRDAGLDAVELQAFLDYAAQFLGNCGNYSSFGDTKFTPRLEPAKLKALAALAPDAARIYEQLEGETGRNGQTGGGIFGVVPSARVLLGYPDAGHVSTYYPNSPDITKSEIAAVSDFLETKKLLPENTRLRKRSDGNYELLIASEQTNPDYRDVVGGPTWELDGALVSKTVRLVYGDHSKEMGRIANALDNAGAHAANDTQRTMLAAYGAAFRTGSLLAYKESQRQWIRDKGPTVETDIGFIETYRDPHGIRGEWEGFVAMVNKERTRAFGELVEAAPALITKLPWSKEFEKDTFLSPDFTSLEVLTFAGSGIPAGINIPNYDDIRQAEGFKNVSLGNVLSAKAPNEKIPFIKDADREMFERWRVDAFEVQVGLHELLGHGCGKLLQETSPGTYNFDIKNPPVSPLTNKAITCWYKPGQKWGSVFGGIGASYEECRAECVAMFLACDFSILKIFGYGTGEEDMAGPAGDLLYVSYLSMARAGVAALAYWDPNSRKWGQAHMQARFSILRAFLRADDKDDTGQGDSCGISRYASDGRRFASLDLGANGSSITVSIDRAQILSVGRPAVGRYLQRLHVLKATADLPAATALYEDMTGVDGEFELRVRPAVVRCTEPRKVFVQANTVERTAAAAATTNAAAGISDQGSEGAGYSGRGPEAGEIGLVEYPATAEGMIRSWAEREYLWPAA